MHTTPCWMFAACSDLTILHSLVILYQQFKEVTLSVVEKEVRVASSGRSLIEINHGTCILSSSQPEHQECLDLSILVSRLRVRQVSKCITGGKVKVVSIFYILCTFIAFVCVAVVVQESTDWICSQSIQERHKRKCYHRIRWLIRIYDLYVPSL